MRACFDSNILIDYLNGIPEAAETIARYDEPFISVVTLMEVLAGASTGEEEEAALALLARFHLAELVLDVAEAAAAIRSKERTKLPDAIILATARHLRCPLLTRNTKDFGPSDEVVIPYTL